MPPNTPDASRPFPIPLVCPACGSLLAFGAACACPAATRLELWNGIPRVLSGGRREAEDAPEANTEAQSRPARVIGRDFVHGLPWGEIETVLAIGSGPGSMAGVLAARGKTVVVLETFAERARSEAERAARDGLSNWHPLIAGAAVLPFASETFDLITLSGMPKNTDLAGIFRRLKPDGYLCMGVEAGLRARARTPNQHERLFRESGFESVEVFGVFAGSNRQDAFYRLKDVRPRRVTRELVNPPASWKGRLLRAFATRGPWSCLFEEAVVVFGRKSAKAGRLAWSGLPHEGPVTQFGTSDKIFALCFDGKPSSIYKSAKSAQASALVAKEYVFLQAASRRHGAVTEAWPLRWPKPLGVHRIDGRDLYHYEFAHGVPLSNLLLPVSFSLGRSRRLIARLVDGYVELCVKMTAASTGASPENAWDELLNRLAAVPTGDSACDDRIRAACGALRGKSRPTHFTHGDLSLSNTMLLPDGAMVLVDWENAVSGGAVAIDLMRLLNDTWDESQLLKTKSRRALMESTKRAVREALTRVGVGPEDYAGAEALFVAHQFEQWYAKDPGAATSPRAEHLRRKYRDREFAPAG